MPRMMPYQLAEYHSDLGIKYEELRFKISEYYGKDLAGKLGYKAPIGGLCSPTFLFKPRAVIATYKDGAKIRFPVPSPQKIKDAVEELLKLTDVVCIDLDGEEWRVIPPSVGDYTPKFQNFQLPDGKAKKITGVMLYSSDIAGKNTPVRFAVEAEPNQVITLAKGCWNDRGPKSCASPIPIRARHVIFYGTGKTLKSATGFEHTQKIVRKFPVEDLVKLCNCIKRVGREAECLGYKGESVRNVHLLFDKAKKCNSSPIAQGGAGGLGGSP